MLTSANGWCDFKTNLLNLKAISEFKTFLVEDIKKNTGKSFDLKEVQLVCWIELDE